MIMSNKITFIDNIGRNILAEMVGATDTHLKVKNPAVINIAQAENGQLQVQIIPLFLPEFLSPETRVTGTQWTYAMSSIVLPDAFTFDARLEEQYDRITSSAFGGVGQAVPSSPDSESVVKLFDE